MAGLLEQDIMFGDPTKEFSCRMSVQCAASEVDGLA